MLRIFVLLTFALAAPAGAQHSPLLDHFNFAVPELASDMPLTRVNVPENPGPMPDINARQANNEAKTPGTQVHDTLSAYQQVMQPAPRPGPLMFGADPKGVYSFASLAGERLLVRTWRHNDEIAVLVGRFTADLGRGWINELRLPLDPATGVWAGDTQDHRPNDIAAAIARGGDLLISLDTLNRCSGERRYGFVIRLSADLSRIKWVSPMRSAGGRGFGFNDTSLFVVDGGSCEKDYLYELDMKTGQVKTRTIVPSAQDRGDFTALYGKDLYLVLYNRLIHYKLP